MNRVRVTKIFPFEMAHALHGYDGNCAQIHGHSYRLHVTIIGHPISDSGSPKLGMVIDFGDLKKIVNERIISKLDHALVLSKAGGSVYSEAKEPLQRALYMDFQPTCENLISYISSELRPYFSSEVSLHSLRLEETATSFAEWFAMDND